MENKHEYDIVASSKEFLRTQNCTSIMLDQSHYKTKKANLISFYTCL